VEVFCVSVSVVSMSVGLNGVEGITSLDSGVPGVVVMCRLEVGMYPVYLSRCSRSVIKYWGLGRRWGMGDKTSWEEESSEGGVVGLDIFRVLVGIGRMVSVEVGLIPRRLLSNLIISVCTLALTCLKVSLERSVVENIVSPEKSRSTERELSLNSLSIQLKSFSL